MEFPTFLPWQLSTATDWLAQTERFSHAWLIHGVPGIGKRRFALAAAASLLCASPQAGLACTRCQSCLWFASSNHPDFRLLRPDALAQEESAHEPHSATSTESQTRASHDIRIEQVRALDTWFNTTTHRGGWRIVLLYPAQALNVVSANALLKVLEEPPARTLFLIVADAPDQLIATLVSRCRRLALHTPATDASVSWLTEQGVQEPWLWLSAASEAPLAALERSQQQSQACPEWLTEVLDRITPGDSAQVLDLGTTVERLIKIDAANWIDALQRWVFDMALLKLGLPARYFPTLKASTNFAVNASLDDLTATARWLGEQRRLAGHPLNPALFAYHVLQRTFKACGS